MYKEEILYQKIIIPEKHSPMRLGVEVVKDNLGIRIRLVLSYLIYVRKVAVEIRSPEGVDKVIEALQEAKKYLKA